MLFPDYRFCLALQLFKHLFDGEKIVWVQVTQARGLLQSNFQCFITLENIIYENNETSVISTINVFKAIVR